MDRPLRTHAPSTRRSPSGKGSATAGIRVGIDIGGTFTDVLAYDEEGLVFRKKLPSAPDSSASFQAAFAALWSQHLHPAQLCYSTTVATNALLEQQLPPIGLLVTEGFRHILELTQPQTDEENTPMSQRETLRPLVPLERIREVRERMDAKGRVQRPLDEDAVRTVAAWCRVQGLTTIAVSLLHSYRNPAHERRLRHIFGGEDPHLRVVLSSDVFPEFHEYERTVATCLNASLLSLMGNHLDQVTQQLEQHGVALPLLVMQSSGGLRSTKVIRQRPLATLFSGPSAAAVGMARLGVHAGVPDLITLDMGGTSADIALIQDGCPLLTTRGQVGGYPIRTLTIDIISIGAGGGSIATVGADQRWHIGPRSAGSRPGPVCYGRGGTEVTVTDANLLLGRLPPTLLNGEISLYAQQAEEALASFGQSRSKGSAETAADLIQLVNHNMCGVIRRGCTQRGLDPRDSVLMAVGGAGPLHAVDLADLLGIATIIVPRDPGFAAAAGLFVADIREDLAQACPQKESALDPAQLTHIMTELEQQAQIVFAEENIPATSRQLIRSVDCHYLDMSAQLTMDLPEGTLTSEILQQAIAQFHNKHEQLYGFAFRQRREVVLTTLRMGVIGIRPKFALPAHIPPGPDVILPKAERAVFFFAPNHFVDCPVYDRTVFGAGARLNGPAIIEQYDTTTLIPPHFQAHVDMFGNLILKRAVPGYNTAA